MYTYFKLIKNVKVYYILRISQYLFENIYFLNTLGLAACKEYEHAWEKMVYFIQIWYDSCYEVIQIKFL